MIDDKNICIMGMGYVGLTLAVAMAQKGYKVHGVEINQEKLEKMKRGKPFFYEVGLEGKLNEVINNEKLMFSNRIPSEEYGVYIITVGTPLIKNEKKPRFDMIENVTKEIREVMDNDSLVVLRSTVAIGTTRDKVIPILKEKVDNPYVAFCSERTLEGKAMEEIFTLPQIIGATDENCLNRAKNIFNKLTPTVVGVSSIETAEIIKLLDNAYRDTHFALGNEVAEMCEKLGIDGSETIRAANFGYERTNIACPGYVGGPCLEKDPYILEDSLRPYNFFPKIIMSSRHLNERLQGRIAERISNWAMHSKLDAKNAKISLLGMAFKGSPEIDDLRGAPSVLMVDELRDRGFTKFYGHDYLVSKKDIESFGVKAVDVNGAFKNANAVIFMNNNPAYNKINIYDLSNKMSSPAFLMDSWNMFRTNNLPEKICYGTIGKYNKEHEGGKI